MSDIIAQKITRVIKWGFLPLFMKVSNKTFWFNSNFWAYAGMEIAMCLHPWTAVQREGIDYRSTFRNISPTLALWLATSQYWPSPVSGTPSMEGQIRGIFPVFLHQIECVKKKKNIKIWVFHPSTNNHQIFDLTSGKYRYTWDFRTLQQGNFN